MSVTELIEKGLNGYPLTPTEIEYLLGFPPYSEESFQLMAGASALSRQLQHNEAEVHGQLALNLAPCPEECQFCSFAKSNKIFTTATEVPIDEAVAMACQFEQVGCQAILVMTTANFAFKRIAPYLAAIRARLKKDTPLIANVGDQCADHAEELVQLGVNGVYHAVRLREGIDTNIPPQQRRDSIAKFKAAGLQLGVCVEPLGPEHSDQEIAEMIHYTASLNPVFSGAARRIPIPGTRMGALGTIPEIRQAQVVAITRLAMPHTTIANCTHEPGVLPGMGGASFFWAEMGANPRDTVARTEDGRAHNVSELETMFWELDWKIQHGPSRIWSA
ncbi:MAG: radical SAM protein [Desulfobacteraceae bacterium 4572_35.2]|nr:MAG: radical SAM protein [Desulfobacteraceae bacterium 4572_35.2]